MADTQEILKSLDGVAFIREILPDAIGPDQSGEVRFLCPFHEDSSPSAQFNINSKLFQCFSCPASGSAIDLLAQVTEKPRHVALEYLARQLGVTPQRAINPKLVEEWHQTLRINANLLEELERKQGIDVASTERWRLGWSADEKRLTIPVRDEPGNIMNVRKYDLTRVHDSKKKYLNVKGHGQLRLWPMEALQHKELIITEGELKMIGLAQRGFDNTLTATGGAKGWKDEWNKHFEGKKVAIVYDIDAAGRSRGKSLARRLQTFASEIRVVSLPLDHSKHPHGDVNDYFVKEGYSAQDFKNLLLGTPIWDPDEERPISPGLRDDLEYEVDLNAASKAQYYLRNLKLNVIVSAKDTAPYIAPKDIQVDCPKDMDICAACPVMLEYQRLELEGSKETNVTWQLDADDPALLKLIAVSEKKQQQEMQELIGIPGKCQSSEVIVADSHNIEEVRIVPEMTRVDQFGSSEQVVTKAYHVGHGIETNTTYEIKARSVVEPTTQHATLLIHETTSNVDSLSSFEPSEKELQDLVVFQPLEWSVKGLDDKFDELYNDFEANVTRVYQRRHLHVLMDLAWHSVLYIRLTDESVKGWADVLVLGDSGQGKSETAIRLLRHYGLGEKIDMKGASIAGLKGGLQDTQGRWFVTWGVIPLNDRKLVVLEEVKGASPELLQSLTEMRSSGVAELTKIERRRAFARTRLVWLSNPRSDRSIDTYNFGVMAIRELMGSLEDVRRFDAAIIVSSNEVDAKVISQSSYKTAQHVHTSELCRRLILWAWSRRPEQVIFEEDARKQCYDLAVTQSQKYSAAIPLVEPADHRYKLARLSAALAARTFSCDESGQRLIIKKAHVDWVAKFLDELYSSRYHGYQRFSEIQAIDAELVNGGELKDALIGLPFPAETIRGLMRTNEIRSVDIIDWAGIDRDSARDLMSLLVRNNGLRRGRNGYYKTGPFIEFLNAMKVNGSIPEHVRKELDY